MNICVSEGCSKKPVAKNLCRSCYNRAYKEGRIQVRRYKTKTASKCVVEACPNTGNVTGAQKGLCREHADHERKGIPLRTLEWTHERLDGSRQCRNCGDWVPKKIWSKRLPSYERNAQCDECLREGRSRRQLGRHKRKFNELLVAQGGKCAGCGSPNGEKYGRRLSLDHDHRCCPNKKVSLTCGECIRGLLCTDCNVALGYLRDNVETLQNLIEYLQSN